MTAPATQAPNRDAGHGPAHNTHGLVSAPAALEAALPWYDIVQPLSDGRRDLIVRIKCANDAHAADDLSADMFPGAEVWEGKRFVATLPPLGFLNGKESDAKRAPRDHRL